jgi:hypothetical protein
MITIKVDGHEYRIGKLNAIKQFHVARKVAPVLALMGVTAHQLSQGIGEGGLDDFMPLLAPITDVVSRMSTEDADFVLFECLGAVERAIVLGPSETKHQRVTTMDRQLVFQDMEMPTMLRLVVEVIKDNLGGFLKGLGEEAPSPSP